MTITVDIRPEVQAELARQAAAHGSAIEDYAATLLEKLFIFQSRRQLMPKSENAREEKAWWKYARW